MNKVFEKISDFTSEVKFRYDCIDNKGPKALTALCYLGALASAGYCIHNASQGNFDADTFFTGAMSPIYAVGGKAISGLSV